MFDFMETWSWFCDGKGLICHIPHHCAIFWTNIFALSPCVHLIAEFISKVIELYFNNQNMPFYRWSADSGAEVLDEMFRY